MVFSLTPKATTAILLPRKSLRMNKTMTEQRNGLQLNSQNLNKNKYTGMNKLRIRNRKKMGNS